MTFDTAQFKRLERTGYNRLGRRYLDAAARRTILAEGLLDAAALGPGLAVLDLASGPGLLASAATRTLGPTGFVIASDIAEAQLACCPPHAGLTRVVADGEHLPFATAGLTRVVADGEHLPFATASLDRVLCGLGLMLFPDADVALAEMRRVLRPRGRLSLSVWGNAEDVPLIDVALSCIRRLLPAPKVARPSIFRFGDATDLQRRLTSADFCDIRIVPLQFSLDFPDAASYWQAFLDLAGGAAESLARLPDAKQAELAREVALELAPYAIPAIPAIPATSGGYRLNSRILIATGQTSISTGPI